MRKLHYKKINAFTDGKSSGNPAGVVWLKADEILTKAEMLTNMAFPVPEFKDIPKDIPDIANRFTLEDNPLGLNSISFQPESNDGLICILNYNDRAESVLRFNFNKPESGEDVFIKDIQFHKQQYISFAAWNNNNSLQLTLYYIETPYVVTYLVEFKDDQIELAFHMNGSMNLQDFVVSGKL